MGCLPFLAAMGALLAKAATASNTKAQEAYTEVTDLLGCGGLGLIDGAWVGVVHWGVGTCAAVVGLACC